jgi:hypothetical protein
MERLNVTDNWNFYLDKPWQSKLIGKVVDGIDINDEGQSIAFWVDNWTYAINWHAKGGCCSSSWIEDILHLDELIGAKVLSITCDESKNIADPTIGQARGHECLDAIFYAIHTDKGGAKIEMRNGSNGYYTGWLEEELFEEELS